MKATDPGYNGPVPTKEEYFQFLGNELEYEYQRMRWTSKSGHNQAAYEARGGDRSELQKGLKLSKMTAAEQAADAMSINRVYRYHGVTKEESDGQFSFTEALTAAAENPDDYRTFPLGSPPSLGLAKLDGHRCGKKGILGLADNPWPADSAESGIWAEEFGIGMSERPPEKPRRFKPDTAEDVAAAVATDDGQPPAAPRRGRPPKSKNKSATQAMAEQAHAMDNGARPPRKGAGGMKALPAPEAPPSEPPADDDTPGWRADRDFHEEPPPPVH